MKIVKSLKRFSRVDMETVGKVDMNQSIEDAIEILSIPGTENVAFIKDIREIPLVKCSPGEINQCLLPILKNSLDAVTNDGKINISTSFSKTKNHITVQIVDNGKGMSKEVMRQAFNPFFTTKPVGSGTGVGLSLTERIIKRYGGTINILSTEGEGTTITITLPVS